MPKKLGFYQELNLFNKSWGGDNSGEALERLQREESPDCRWGSRWVDGKVPELKVNVVIVASKDEHIIRSEIPDFFELAASCPGGVHKRT
jgi:hypothetical protein